MTRQLILTATLTVFAVLTFDVGTVFAQLIFSEPFDNPALPGWNVVADHFKVSEVLSGSGERDRGAMFHSAANIDELRFSFFRTENVEHIDNGDTVELGIVGNTSVTIYNTLSEPRVSFYADSRTEAWQKERVGFYVYTGNSAPWIWDLSQVATGGWFDGLIRLEPLNKVVFGYRAQGIGAYTTIETDAPLGLNSRYVGATAYHLPAAQGVTLGISVLDNLTAFAFLNRVQGDYNNNGVVDAADYTVWRNTLGSNAQLRADGNGNGAIDRNDFEIWRDNYGLAAGAAAIGPLASVPEPASLILLLAALASQTLALRRRRFFNESMRCEGI